MPWLALAVSAEALVAQSTCIENRPTFEPPEEREKICAMLGQLPFTAREIWVEKDAYYFAAKEQIARKRRVKTVMVFSQDGQPITDMATAGSHAARLSKRRNCDVTEGPVPADPTAQFVLSCPL